MTHTTTTRRTDDGAALIMSLLLSMALSAIAISLIFLSQTETMSSLNYRLMSQARYAAEAGVHRSVNFLLNNYVKPGDLANPLLNYDLTASPVTFNGQPVVLSSVPGVASNYPVAAVSAAFFNDAHGTLPVGSYNTEFTVTATLVSMREITVYGSGAKDRVLTWRITGIGAISGNQPAQVEVTSILEQQAVPTHTYGVFATDAACGALTFAGNSSTDSYDSTNLVLDAGGNVVTQLNGGDVGTNGNLTENSATINGSLSTPRSGVGSCNNGNVTALTQNGGATVTGGVITLPQTLAYPTPAVPSPLPPTGNVSIAGPTTCGGAGISAMVCSGPPGNLTLHPVAPGAHVLLGDLRLSGGSTIHLTAGTYDFNSISLTGNSTVIIDSGPVILNVVGNGQSSPIDFSGGSVQNPSMSPGNFEIRYAGTGTVKVSGGTQTAAMVFAPNAAVNVTGGSHFYGAILGATVTDTGGTAFHYDRSLQNDFFVVGNYMLTAFSWKKY